MLSLDVLVSITSTLWLHYFWNTQLCRWLRGMTQFCDSLSLFFFPFSLLLLIFLILISLSHWICPFCHLFIVSLHLLPLHCLHSFSLHLCYSHPLSLSSMHSLFHNLSLFHSLLLFFSFSAPLPPSVPLPVLLFFLYPSSSCFFISLHQHHVCHGLKHRKQWSLLNNYHAKQSK